VEVEYEDEDEKQSDAGIDFPKNIESIADDENEVKITNDNDIIPISSLPTIDENRLNNFPEIIQSSNDESITKLEKNNAIGEIVRPVQNIDFSQAKRNSDGKLCILKEEMVETMIKTPLKTCIHKNIEKCHYTYITTFTPTQQEVCDESFQKHCQINFVKSSSTEVVKKCYTPVKKVCDGTGPEICKTVYESSCTTKYIDKSQNGTAFVGDTQCEKLPVKICGQGCQTFFADEECHDKEIGVVLDLPEEICDLIPQKTCRMATKMVPKLIPEKECTLVPKQVCNVSYGPPEIVQKPYMSEWCLDESNAIEDNDVAQPPNPLQEEVRSRGRRRKFRNRRRGRKNLRRYNQKAKL